MKPSGEILLPELWRMLSPPFIVRSILKTTSDGEAPVLESGNYFQVYSGPECKYLLGYYL